MHQSVLDSRCRHRDPLRVPSLGPLQGVLDSVVQLIPQAPVITLDFFARRPIRRRVRGQSPIHWVNAKRKQLIKCPLKRSQSESALRQQIPVERFYMANVEYDPMSLWNRAVVHRLFAHDAKYLVGSRAGAEQSGVKVMPDADG